MKARVSCALCFLLLAGVAAAQNASRAPLHSASSARRDSLIDCRDQRLRWEAAETWSRPQVPTANTEAEPRPIHIDQPTPATPKIRREWLQISPEAVTGSQSALDQYRSSLTPRPER